MSEPTRIDLDAIEARVRRIESVLTGGAPLQDMLDVLGDQARLARADVPALLAEVRSLRAAVETLFAGARVRTEQRDELRLALALLVACINTSADDAGPPFTQGSMMARACKVIRNTSQFEQAQDALARSTTTG